MSPGLRPLSEIRLICPVCREAATDGEVDPTDLTCKNSACCHQYGWLGEGIPLLYQPERESFERCDAFGVLPSTDSEWEKKLSLLLPETDEWSALSLASMYLETSLFPGSTDLSEVIFNAIKPYLNEGMTQAADLGCGLGALTLALSKRTALPFIGMDIHPHLLRWAVRLSRGQAVSYPHLRSSTAFEMKVVEQKPVDGRVIWLCADGQSPPLEAESLDLVIMVNYLDSVNNPYVALGQASALLRPGGVILFLQPDAWSAQVTPIDRWVREEDGGWEALLPALGLEAVERIEGIAWALNRAPNIQYRYTLNGYVALRGVWPEGP
jgi:SAM-dependent methyltransferase